MIRSLYYTIHFENTMKFRKSTETYSTIDTNRPKNTIRKSMKYSTIVPRKSTDKYSTIEHTFVLYDRILYPEKYSTIEHILLLYDRMYILYLYIEL